jgi:transcriptional regulator with XRE-family HTH domain
MAKSRSRIDQPGGEKISVGPDERAFFKMRREAKGLGQAELGKKVGASQGTISNLESGRHTQVTKTTYAKLVQVLGKSPTSPNAQQVFKEIVGDLVDVPESQLNAVRDLVRALKSSAAPQPRGDNEQTRLDGDRPRTGKGSRGDD